MNDLRKRNWIGEQVMADDVADVVKVVFVDGENVRDDQDNEFSLGGHHYRYGFIPEDEVWVESSLGRGKDGVAVVIHEIVERAMMKMLGVGYDEAHKLAGNAEKALRK